MCAKDQESFVVKLFLLILVHNWQWSSASRLLLPVKIKQHTNPPTSESPRGDFNSFQVFSAVKKNHCGMAQMAGCCNLIYLLLRTPGCKICGVTGKFDTRDLLKQHHAENIFSINLCIRTNGSANALLGI